MPSSQRDRAVGLLKKRGIVRLKELISQGVTAATISRMEREGAVLRLARGLYQLPDAAVDTHNSLALAAKLVPKGVMCLSSALVFHELTDQIPAKIWMAIGPKD
jgi:predicted transcriptional regulator of viral defense system